MAIKTYYLLKKYIDPTEKNLPFYVEDVSGSSSTITLAVNSSYGDVTNLEYSTDNVTWSSTKPSIPANGRVYIRANATYWGTSTDNANKISSSMNYNVGGNIMSLLYGSSFTGTETSFPDPTKQHIFKLMFGGVNIPWITARLQSVEKLALPAMTLTGNCYYGMFSNCTSITAAPILPATTLAGNCYNSMFSNCTSLTSAPALPATTLVNYCYYEMFRGCTSLTAYPMLPATTLVNGCYYNMFNGCSNLSSITVGATSWNTSYTGSWVQNVSATGTFTKPSGTTIPEGTSGIPSGWTVVNV